VEGFFGWTGGVLVSLYVLQRIQPWYWARPSIRKRSYAFLFVGGALLIGVGLSALITAIR